MFVNPWRGSSASTKVMPFDGNDWIYGSLKKTKFKSSGTGSPPSLSVTLHHLQNPKWLLGGIKIFGRSYQFSQNRFFDPNTLFMRGGVIIKMRKNLGKIPDYAWPPSPPDQNYLKNADPPHRSNSDFLNLRTFWWRNPPRTDIWKGLFRHIYIWNGHIKFFVFIF